MKENLKKLGGKFPVSFKMFGQTIKTKVEPDLYFRVKALGESNYRANEIKIQPIVDDSPFDPAHVKHTWWHEFVHFLLYYGGGDEFNPALDDLEYLVDRLAGLLHQAITTMEFED